MNFFSDSKLTTTTSTIYLRTLSFVTKKALSHGICFEVCQPPFFAIFLVQGWLFFIWRWRENTVDYEFGDRFWKVCFNKKKLWEKKNGIMNEKKNCMLIHFIGRFNECLNKYDTYFLHLLTHICRNKVKWVGIYVTLICDANDVDLPRKKNTWNVLRVNYVLKQPCFKVFHW